MKNTHLEQALRQALEGRGGPAEWAAICADAACRAGLDYATIEAMTASLKPDALQRRLDDLMPDAPADNVVYDELPEGLIDLPSACREHGVKTMTAHNWLRRGLLKSMGKLKGRGTGGVNVVNAMEFAEVVNMPKNKGGRPAKNLTK